MIKRTEILDYASNTYVSVSTSKKCRLYRNGEFIKLFESYGEAICYWLENFCN